MCAPTRQAPLLTVVACLHMILRTRFWPAVVDVIFSISAALNPGSSCRHNFRCRQQAPLRRSTQSMPQV
ncbi:hypothetical protein BURKHO8Y_70111 [Burkholderia sp. 8Y]|nr:hypothetical protein BURKHO8Y_70111 [Burkholderia sp. 8Y]